MVLFFRPAPGPFSKHFPILDLKNPRLSLTDLAFGPPLTQRTTHSQVLCWLKAFLLLLNKILLLPSYSPLYNYLIPLGGETRTQNLPNGKCQKSCNTPQFTELWAARMRESCNISWGLRPQNFPEGSCIPLQGSAVTSISEFSGATTFPSPRCQRPSWSQHAWSSCRLSVGPAAGVGARPGPNWAQPTGPSSGVSPAVPSEAQTEVTMAAEISSWRSSTEEIL